MSEPSTQAGIDWDGRYGGAVCISCGASPPRHRPGCTSPDNIQKPDDVGPATTWVGGGRPSSAEPFPGSDAECFIQWKGTEACIDIYCPCSPNEPRHFDGMFGYLLRCTNCGAVYEMGTQVKMRRLADDDPAREDAHDTEE